MSYENILGIDPSGNFHEGKGTTGWCLLNTTQNKLIHTATICAKHFDSMESYWHAHLKLIKDFSALHPILVIEDYLLYKTKATNQINSKMETPKLLGTLQHFLWLKQMPYVLQPAALVKTRWADDILLHKGYIRQDKNKFISVGPEVIVNLHMRDAIRHAVHYKHFKNQGG